MHPDDVMPQLLARRAAEDPDKLFALQPDGTVATRQQLHTRALQWSSVLRDLGISTGDTVLMMLPTSIEAVATWIGIGWLRAIEVPINTQYRGEMLTYACNDSLSNVLIIDAQYLDRLDGVLERCPKLQTIVILGGDHDNQIAGDRTVLEGAALLETASPLPAESLTQPTAEDIASIIYTSGTTGPSKGVLVPWGQLYTMARWAPLHDSVGPDDRIYAPFPFFHTTIKSPVYAMLQAGGSVVIHEKFSSKTYWDNVREHQCTVGLLLGGMARMLMLAPARPDDANTSLRLVVMVPAIPEVREFEQRFGVKAGTIFGMTEVSTPLLTLDWNITEPSSCGQPRPGVQVRIIDKAGQDVPVGEMGELIVRCTDRSEMNSGYWNKPEATARAWDQDGWFHTGDAFRRDEHDNYFYVDRFKDAIRRRGENISSVELENIVGSFAGVELCAAFGVPAEHGDEDVMVVVQRSPGHDFDAETLVAYLEARMPRFMVPRYVAFTDTMPMTVTQKVRKLDLRRRGVTESTWDREAAVPAGG
jgi:crotonobetaine/carnitine-CoA ligase